jgi:hypothetical protein
MLLIFIQIGALIAEKPIGGFMVDEKRRTRCLCH